MILKFYLLGPANVTWKQIPLNIARRQVRTLLYPLTTKESAVPLERLHYLLWSDKPEIFCRPNLSHRLTHTRKSLPKKEIIIVINADFDPAKEAHAVQEMISRSIDGGIFVESSQIGKSSALEIANKPCVFVHRLLGSPVNYTVAVDDADSAR